VQCDVAVRPEVNAISSLLSLDQHPPVVHEAGNRRINRSNPTCNYPQRLTATSPERVICSREYPHRNHQVRRRVCGHSFA
jgi:hypothetical protein